VLFRSRAVESLNETMLDLVAAVDRAPSGERGRALSDLLDVAVERRDLLADLIEVDPRAALAAALPEAARKRLPREADDFVERLVDVEGKLEVLYEDGRSSRLRYSLETTGSRLSLHFGGEPPALLTGTAVRAHGLALGQAVALDSAETSLVLLERPNGGGGSSGGTTPSTPTTLPNTLGAQKTLVVLVNFQDAPTEPYTAADAQAVVFGTTSDYFRENSSGQTWLTGDVRGWFTIPQSSTVCDTSAIATQADAEVAATGIDPKSYAHVVYAFPQISCGWWGLSSVGGTPSLTWITGDLKLGVTAHELGHSLGLFHSHALDCGATTLGSTCTTYEYGDTIDMMGASAFGHFNPFQKERLGWLNAGSSPAITTVTASGTYTIDAYESAGSGPKALRVLKSVDATTGKRTWYYVNARQALGFDAGFAGYGNVVGGLSIGYGTESLGSSSYLLDMTPASGSSIYYDWGDPALASGGTFVDSAAGVTIKTEWVSASSAAVTVQVPSSGSTSTAPKGRK